MNKKNDFPFSLCLFHSTCTGACSSIFAHGPVGQRLITAKSRKRRM